MSGQISPDVYLWNGSPVGVSLDSLNPPKGALIVDITSPALYVKSSERGDNSGYSISGSSQRVAADVNNSDGTTLATVLSVPIAANQSLRLDYFLNLFDGSGTGQLYLDMAIPSGASKIVFGSITELDEDASYTTHMFQAFPFDANGLSGFDSAHIFVSSISVIVNNGSTAGTVDLKFRASSNILTDVATVKKGSCVAVF